MRLNPETPARSPKTSDKEAWQTPDDVDINYSTRPDQEKHIHNPDHLRRVPSHGYDTAYVENPSQSEESI